MFRGIERSSGSSHTVTMDLLPHITAYYDSERIATIAAFITGAVLLLAAFLARARGRTSTWGRGLFWPLLVAGGLLTVSTPLMWMKNEERLERLPQPTDTEWRAFAERDHERMQVVNRSWWPFQVFWCTLALGGAGLLLAGRAPRWKGLGLGLMIVGGLGALGDSMASAQAETYTRHLESALREEAP